MKNLFKILSNILSKLIELNIFKENIYFFEK